MPTELARRAGKYTFPVISIYRTWDGRTGYGVGSCIVLNKDGWVLTTSHVAEFVPLVKRHREEREEHERRVAEIESSPGLTSEEKREQLGPTPPNPDWITNHVLIWGVPGFEELKPVAREIRADIAADLAVARLEPFDPARIEDYPVFLPRAAEIPPRAALYRFGFLPDGVRVAFKEAEKFFDIELGSGPLRLFASVGIHARELLLLVEQEARDVTLIDILGTAAGGLSGGPVLDAQGRLCGLQIGKTNLGFELHTHALDAPDSTPTSSPKYVRAVHARSIGDFLAGVKIPYQEAEPGTDTRTSECDGDQRHAARDEAGVTPAGLNGPIITIVAAREQLSVSDQVMGALVASGLLGPVAPDGVPLAGVLDYALYGTQWRPEVGERLAPYYRLPVIPGKKGGVQPTLTYSQARISGSADLEAADRDIGWIAEFYLRANRYFFPSPAALAAVGPLHLRLEEKRGVTGAALPTCLYPDPNGSLAMIAVVGNPRPATDAFQQAYDVVMPLLDELSFTYDQPLAYRLFAVNWNPIGRHNHGLSADEHARHD